MELTDLRTFWYYREQSLNHLVDLARTSHYSPFDLYGDAELRSRWTDSPSTWKPVTTTWMKSRGETRTRCT